MVFDVCFDRNYIKDVAMGHIFIIIKGQFDFPCENKQKWVHWLIEILDFKYATANDRFERR